MTWRRVPERWLGLLRSLILYWRPGRQKSLRNLYRPFMGPGDLVFDVGAHLGDRTVAFASLGARVVALEPQPHVRRWLERLAGRRRGVTVRQEALGRALGTASLAISRRTPTVSTLAEGWRETLPQRESGYPTVHWEERVEVPVITLDRLIDLYGLPRFCKIDVEGYEAEVLAGLTHPIPALSFEFASWMLQVSDACVRRIESLGPYEFNAIGGEGRTFLWPGWIGAKEMIAWLTDGAGGWAFGDVYARMPLPTEAAGEDRSDP